MAMRSNRDIEEAAGFVLRQIHPRPYNPEGVDPANVVVSYDRLSDTLLIHLFGRGHLSTSVPISRYLYVMVDLDTEKTIGFHIEGFLAQAIKDIPEATKLLDYAELRGLTVAEVRDLQRETLGATDDAWWTSNAGSESLLSQRWQAVSAFINALRARWDLAFVPEMP